MKILFICKYNVFRSKVAEAYFNKINKNKNITAFSRGFIMGGFLDKTQKKIAKKFGLKIKQKQNPVNLKELIKADKIIVVGKDIPGIMFDYQLIPLKKKVKIWEIKDEQKQNSKKVEMIIKKIIKKTDELNQELKNKK